MFPVRRVCRRIAAETTVSTVFTAIDEVLARAKHITLIGFGTFSVKSWPVRESRNPLIGKRITIGASKTVSFKAVKTLKNAVN